VEVVGVYAMFVVVRAKSNIRPSHSMAASSRLGAEQRYVFGVVVRSDAPWKTFQELLADAKANPGKINIRRHHD